jgi:gluconate:H+ symporter, GntP family
MSLIASDIMRFSRNPLFALNILGFLFSVPTMCYILAYVIFIPIAKELSTKLNNPSISTATALALGAVASFNLVYPSPVIISAAEELSANTDTLILLGFFIAVPTSTVGYLYARRLGKIETARISENNHQGQVQPGSTEATFTEASFTEAAFTEAAFTEVVEASQKDKAGVIQEKAIEAERKKRKDGVQRKDAVQRSETGKLGRLEVYAPIFFPLILILFQAGFEHPHSLFVFLGNPNVALLIGVLLSIFSGRVLGFAMVRILVEKAVRRSGVVLLDLCGGGALGATLAMTGAGEALGRLFL